MNDSSRLSDAALFSTQRHTDHRRKHAEKSPYIDHPLSVERLLSVECGVTDIDVLAAALLHDIIEDTKTSVEELQNRFGDEVTKIVLAVTEDKRLPRALREKFRVGLDGSGWGIKSSLVKMADITCNLRDVAASPPVDWSVEQQREYFDGAVEVVRRLRTVVPQLGEAFSAAYSLKPSKYSSSETNCTHVMVYLHGRSGATIRDHEIEKLAGYVAYYRERGAIVTTERGVWIV